MRRRDANDATLDGIAAYAEKQAHLCECLAHRCAVHWLPGLKEKDIFPEWGIHPQPIHNHLQPTPEPFTIIYNISPAHSQSFTTHPRTIYNHLQSFTIYPQPIHNHLQPFTTHPRSIYNHLQPLPSPFTIIHNPPQIHLQSFTIINKLPRSIHNQLQPFHNHLQFKYNCSGRSMTIVNRLLACV
jgi:hypothetical protein